MQISYYSSATFNNLLVEIKGHQQHFHDALHSLTFLNSLMRQCQLVS